MQVCEYIVANAHLYPSPSSSSSCKIILPISSLSENKTPNINHRIITHNSHLSKSIKSSIYRWLYISSKTISIKLYYLALTGHDH